MFRLCIAIIAVFLTRDALASTLFNQEQMLNSLIGFYLDQLLAFQDPILQAAKRLFWILCSISLVVSGISLIFQEGSIQSFFAYFVKFILIIGIFHFVLQNAHQIGASILDSFILMPNNRVTVSPSDMLNNSYVLASMLIDKTSMGIVDVPLSIFMVLLSGVFLLSMCLCVIEIITTYISGYMICVCGVIALGFGAYKDTRFIAINYIFTLIAIGMKLLGSIMIISTAHQVLAEIIKKFETLEVIVGYQDAFSLVFIAVFSLMLIRTVPNILANMVLNFSPSPSYNKNIMQITHHSFKLSQLVMSKLSSKKDL